MINLAYRDAALALPADFEPAPLYDGNFSKNFLSVTLHQKEFPEVFLVESVPHRLMVV